MWEVTVITAILGKRIRVTLLEFIIDNVTEVVTLSLLKWNKLFKINSYLNNKYLITK